jgi:APA family basic amino acid/polyamine antiporter
MPEKSAAPKADLVRDLNASHATALVVGTVIGSGIFLVPAEMMQAVGTAKLAFAAWVVGGLLSFFGALTYAELGAMKPQTSGEYVYIRDAYGPLLAFLYSWTWFLIAKPGSIATITTGLVRVLGTFPQLAFLGEPAMIRPMVVSYGQLVAIAATLFISLLNYVGVRRAGNFQLAFTVLKVAMIVGIVGVAFGSHTGSWANFGTTFAGARGGIAGFFMALVATLWAYDGWNDLNQVAGEVRRPERSIPIALILGMALVAGLFLLNNAAVQYMMPAAQVGASERPAVDATGLAVGAWGAMAVSAGMALSMLVTLNGTTMSGARVPFAVARDGYFFEALAEAHPRFHTPSTAIVLQAGMAVLLLLFAGSFRELFSITIFAEWLFYMIAASTVFVFRKKEPDAPRPYKTWGYPVVPALFVAASAVLLYYTFTADLVNSAAGTAVILAGAPVFWFFKKRRKAKT